MAVSAWRALPETNGAGLLRLNLGSGKRKLAGFINIDDNPALQPDRVRDVRRGLPYSDNSVWELQASDFLEHLGVDDTIFVLNECHRVLVPTGSAVFRVPNALSKLHPEWALGDPTHRSMWTVHRWDYWTAGHEQHEFNGAGYGILPWRVQIMPLDEGDSTIQATCQPVKER